MHPRLGQLFFFLILLPVLTLGSRATFAQSWPAPPKLAAPNWMLIDATTGQTLASANADSRINPASLSKLMTAYLTFAALRERKIRLDQNVASPTEAEIPQGARMFLLPSKDVSVAELLQGLIILGAHDAAIALSKAISGSESAFVESMNKAAQRLGMSNTHFANATGVPHPEHYSTVADLVKLANNLISEYPEHLREFGRRELTYNGIRQVNRNRLLWLDNSVDGLMTGRSETEGFALAVSAHRPQPLGTRERMQRRLIAVIAGAATEEVRAQEGLKLLNFGFQQFDILRLFRADEASENIPVFKGTSGTARLHFPRDVLVAIPRGRADNIRTQLERPNALLAPVSIGQPVGQLRIWLGDTEIHQVPVSAAESVKAAGLLGRAIDAMRLWWRAL
ncbi:MAG: D-alanyl-D-alanine carboxypeptidase [Burkholderiaceae bacterium]|nr:D-alanyl-D-alanine carboxypeptidase [Burkholderiaceae bacterium]